MRSILLVGLCLIADVALAEETGWLHENPYKELVDRHEREERYEEEKKYRERQEQREEEALEILREMQEERPED